jgi:aminomethyltransferase
MTDQPTPLPKMCFDLSQTFARIRVRGKTGADFLHRMSTGDLIKIQPGETRRTVFTTPIGRMIDVAQITAFDNSLLMISSFAQRHTLLRWLRKYVFFNDDVQFADESEQNRLMGVWADSAEGAQKAANIFGAMLTMPAPTMNQWVGVYALCNEITGDCASLDAYEDRRILAFLPQFGSEISEDYIPLEAGLWDAVSFRKGCYIGQEIIARLESRGQLAKKLVRLGASQGLLGGQALFENGVNVGKITSATRDGKHGMGYVRSAQASDGTRLFNPLGDEVIVIEA